VKRVLQLGDLRKANEATERELSRELAMKRRRTKGSAERNLAHVCIPCTESTYRW